MNKASLSMVDYIIIAIIYSFFRFDLLLYFIHLQCLLVLVRFYRLCIQVRDLAVFSLHMFLLSTITGCIQTHHHSIYIFLLIQSSSLVQVAFCHALCCISIYFPLLYVTIYTLFILSFSLEDIIIYAVLENNNSM